MQYTKLQSFWSARQGTRSLLLLALALLLLAPTWVAADADSPQGNPSAPEGVHPSQVVLASFTANPVDSRIVVEWNTETEQFNSGFNLYRAVHGTNLFVRVNEGLIPSQVQQGPGSGTYELVDAAVTAGTRYDYWLESIDFQSMPTYHGLITVEATSNQPVQRMHLAFLPFVAKH